MSNLNYNPGQYFSYDGTLIRIEGVLVDNDQNHTVYYDCLVFSYDDNKSNYSCVPIVLSHDYIIHNFDLVFMTCEDCDNE